LARFLGISRFSKPIFKNIFSKVHSFLYSFIPFVLLAIINLLLIINLRQKQRANMENTNSSVDNKTQLQINLSVIIMTILFIVFTCPSAIASQYYNVLVTSFNGNIILFSMDCFAFSYHALNIIILCFTNKQFTRKLLQIISFTKENRENTSFNTR
jgi:hypothetical protein